MNEKDLTRLHHMLDSAKEVRDFTGNQSKADFKDNRMLALSVTRLIEIIGEAAANVSKDGRQELPNLPWGTIIGMRNRLIHAYFDINLDIVWETVENDIPPLILELEKFLADPG